ncbi:MAG TPA: hypothetical protein VFE47_19230 [Tepidisphaeraceae bacterium]|jgi:hypothetical protein|nr:hypothetical protein [Tepidisphaeraceae bacterium]
MAHQIRKLTLPCVGFGIALLLSSFALGGEKDIPDRIRLLKPDLILAGDDTLQGLIARSKPTLTWNRTDAMWITMDEKNQPHFFAARAQYLAVGGKPARWFFLHESPDEHDMYGPHVILPARLPYAGATMPVMEKIPVHDGGAGSFAIMVERNARFGSLYEIGWEHFWGGSGNNVEGRRIFVLLDPSGSARFIAESPMEDQCNNTSQSCSFKVRWTQAVENPVEIRATVSDFTGCEMNKDESTPLSGLDIRRDGILGVTSETIRWTSEKYMLSKKGESIDTITEDIEDWTNKAAGSASFESRFKVRKAVREKMSSLNPGLPSGRLEPDTRVFIPDPYQLGFELREKKPANK